MEQKKKLPLGVQDFSILRSDDYLYVDKTDLIYDLVHNNRAVFLSRPRRFGKSLLLSTIKYYFLGKKELFTGLAIEKLEAQSKDPWKEYPILYFSLASGEFTESDGLRKVLQKSLFEFEETYELPHENDEKNALPNRFGKALENAYKKTGRRVVVLVDEYDNPLLKTMTVYPEQESMNRNLYKAFFAVLKDYDVYLQFYMFTGVTKFSKISIFSDLNQLVDVSLQNEYSSICGISQEELETYFSDRIPDLAKETGFSNEECFNELKRMYDGYHFSRNCKDMYNPFSLLNCFSSNDFGNFWFESGTPTFLINKLNAARIDVRTFVDEMKVEDSQLKDYRPENVDPVPLFYQSGYLTIKDSNVRQRSYILGFPNYEVKYGFLESLAPSYLNVEDKPAPVKITILDDAVEAGDTEGIKNWFKALFAILPYPAGNTEIIEATTEQNFQNVIFMALTMMGKYARTEVHSAKGRADCILETDDYVYIFEFKRDVSAAQALEQISSQGYATPYAADKRKLYKIGVNFSSAERNISEWVVED